LTTASAGARLDAATAAPAVAAMLCAMFSTQFGTAFAKSLFPAVGAVGVTSLRVTFAALILAALWRPWRRPPSRAAWPALIAYGVALGLMNLTFYLALRTIPLGVGVAVEFVGPLGVAVAASRKPLDFLWIALAVGGLGLLLPIWKQAHPLDPVGLAFMLAAGACWAAYIVFGQRAGKAHGRAATGIGMMVAAVIVIPVGVASAGAKLLSPAVLLPGAAVGLLASVIPYSLEMFALTRLPVRVFGTLLSLAPAVAALMGWLVLHETLGPAQALAIAAIVAASVGTTLSLGGRRVETAAEVAP
jgi:inner membrane transporter RhtA